MPQKRGRRDDDNIEKKLDCVFYHFKKTFEQFKNSSKMCSKHTSIHQTYHYKYVPTQIIDKRNILILMMLIVVSIN